MTDTIQERLRALADYNERQLYPENRCDTVDELREAADRIDALEAENARLRESLECLVLEFDFMVEGGHIPDHRNDVIFVRARKALEG